MRWAWAAAAAAALAAAAYFGIYYAMGEQEHDASTLPPDPAGRRAALMAALQASGQPSRAATILLGQAILETGNFKASEFPLTLSPWNRHVGSGKHGDWNGQVCMIGPDGRWTVYPDDAAASAEDPRYAKEHLRCFDSLEQACRDMAGLLELPLYAHARAALAAGDAGAYAEAIAEGDGKQGFVGPVGTTKANNYTAGLLNTLRTLGVA